MRRFNLTPGERVEFTPAFDDLTYATVHGFDLGDLYGEHPVSITFLLEPQELIRLAEACRQAAKDAAESVCDN